MSPQNSIRSKNERREFLRTRTHADTSDRECSGLKTIKLFQGEEETRKFAHIFGQMFPSFYLSPKRKVSRELTIKSSNDVRLSDLPKMHGVRHWVVFESK